MDTRKFLKLAQEIAAWSKDPSTKVGAVLVRPDRTIAGTGFNGFPRGIEDSHYLLNDRTEKYKRVIHAEMNAILNSRERDLTGYSLYITLFPCERCAVHIIQAGIKEVHALSVGNNRWLDSHNTAAELFDEAGVKYCQY